MANIVTIAARNVQPGDTFVTQVGRERREYQVFQVERIDYEDHLEVKLTFWDNSTYTPSHRSVSFKLHHRIQVRKGQGPRQVISWEPCYSARTNRPRRFR